MRIEIKKDTVACPRTGGLSDVTSCKRCFFLGWVAENQVVCRWSKEKEELIRGERYYENALT